MTDTHDTLLQALAADPADETAWLALADFLEEDNQPQQAELVRLNRALRQREGPAPTWPCAGLASGPAAMQEQRLQQLLLSGVTPARVPILTNSIGMWLALIPAGSFWMGSPEGDSSAWRDEKPLHRVHISQPFYLGIFQVTQAEYRRVVGHNPSHFSSVGEGAQAVAGLDTSNFPVEMVDWHHCGQFCDALSKLPAEQDAGRVYRLPTEAEWEYACRAGTNTRYHFGETLTSRLANFDGTQPFADAKKGPNLRRTHLVGSYPPNAWGLFDMHGNVWEWCADWWESNFYANSPATDPCGPPIAHHRVLRGGSWKNDGFYLRSAHRGWSTMDERIGFRVLLQFPDRPQGAAISGGPPPGKARPRGKRRGQR